MITTSTLQFLKDLSKNNNREWFEQNRTSYEQAKQNVLELSGSLIQRMQPFVPNIEHLQPKDTFFRINRDVRFSKDKTPYKTHFGFVIGPEGKKTLSPGYYVHIEPNNNFIVAGVWLPEKNKLFAIRQEIDYQTEEFDKIVQNKTLKKEFSVGLSTQDMLKKMPKNFEERPETARYLKLKSFLLEHAFTDQEMTDKNIDKTIAAKFKLATPFMNFLNRAIE